MSYSTVSVFGAGAMGSGIAHALAAASVDVILIDVSCHTQPVLHKAYGKRFPFPRIIQRLFDAGRLGLKAGKGIYAEGKIDDESFGRIVGTVSTDPFSIDRCITREVNEAIYCLQEGVGSAEGDRPGHGSRHRLPGGAPPLGRRQGARPGLVDPRKSR